MNERDSEVISGILNEFGYKKTDKINEANLILFNTCCIRERAEDKFLSKLGETKHLKEKDPEKKIIICGCMLQQEGASDKIIKSFPHVDYIFGTHNLHSFADYLKNNLKNRDKTVVELLPSLSIDTREELPVKREFPFKSLINIIYGCNNFCSYCIVPYVRGREKSRAPDNIINEVKSLTAEGVLEIMLLGQNVNSYGKDFTGSKYSFADLLKDIEKIEGIERIRYMTSHPRDFSPKLIETIAKSTKICKHFHLPLQSGSERILKSMNRGYSKKDYFELIQNIRKAVPNAVFTTDIIVGFPGESEEEFFETLSFLEELHMDSAYTFAYSPRSGTPAAKMANMLPTTIKKERLRILNEKVGKISYECNQKYLGQTVPVLVEGLSKKNTKTLTGKTDGGKTVIFEGSPEIIGKIVNVSIDTAQTWILKGTLF